MKTLRMLAVVAAVWTVGAAGAAEEIARFVDGWTPKPLCPDVKTPETSSLFVRYVDPELGVVSYLLRPGLIEDSHKQVYFHNRTTDRGVCLFTKRPPMCTKKAESRLHPDPHPQFVCGDRYVISTINYADGHMDYAVTPVGPLVKLTSGEAM